MPTPSPSSVVSPSPHLYGSIATRQPFSDHVIHPVSESSAS